MKYEKIVVGTFLSRPNRFIAQVLLEGEEVTVHVKNTGRCGELLISGVRVYLQDCDNPKRKTRYDLIAVEKGDLLVNMDSQAPNKVFREWAELGLFRGALSLLQSEKTYGDSRFDFRWECGETRGFVEVKGVTLEENTIACFPDAPTLRGVKHINHLIQAKAEGYEASICFILQMEGMTVMKPNDVTHPEFGEALRRARAAEVEIIALGCKVTADTLTAGERVPVEL